MLALLLLIGTASAAAPQAAFSSNTTSGAAPLTVEFTDTSAGGPTSWAWFFGDETYDQTWTQVNANPDWSKRRAHTAVVLPDGDIILMGGWASGGYQNDTWRSADGGTTWTQMNASSGWTPRAEHTSVAMPDGSIVLMGGFTNVGDANRLNDTWRSTDKGATWTQVNASPGWTARTEHTSVAIGNSILLMGGTDSTVNKNDVWRSTDNGATWTQVNANAGWTGRTDLTAVAMPDDSIVIMGGQGGGYRNDVWRSDNGGTTWTQMTNSAGWSGRESHTAAVLPDGGILLMGGTGSSGRVNDTWRSDDYGATWTQLPDPGWTARWGSTSVAMPDGSIVLMGGYDGVYTNDVWRLQTAGSTEQHPMHTYTAAGTYPVALQAYNADGYDSTRQIDYITVTAAPVPPTAAFSANRTSGTAPLAVEFTDASTGSPIVWNWSFGDGAWHNTTDPAEKNPAHTYAAAGTYTVSLTASNAAGSDTHTEAGYITVAAAPAGPTAAFSGTPTSGAAPLTVDFTDASTGGPTGWAWFFGDETYDQSWVSVNSSFDGAMGNSHAAVAMPDGSIILMGGERGSAQNKTWRSTDYGASWTQLPDAEWEARQSHTAVVMQDGSVTVMGGYGGGFTYYNDTWQLNDGGTTWTRQAEHAGWAARYGHTSVVLSGDSILLMGGRSDINTRFNDTWRSDDGGATWTQQTENAEWEARDGHTAVAMPDGSVILMGGHAGNNLLNDTWRSTNGGETWTLMNESSGWEARYGHTAVAMPDGSVILMGGQDAATTTTYFNDVWRSTDNGTTWTQLPDAGWPARSALTSVAMRDGSIVLMGGNTDGLYRNDVWKLQPAGSSLQNPSHEYDAPGTYTVALQASNAGGYDSTRRTDYITVEGPVAPTAAFSANRTSGAAPLTVAFTDTSTGGPTSWAWDFGDGATSTEQSPAHTYAAAGTYTVGLTVDNAAGSDTRTEAGYITVTAAGALTAAFTGTPTSGAAPLTVSFTDASTGSPTGWAWFFGDETYGEAWTQVTEHAGWSERVCPVAVTMPNGNVVLVGGNSASGRLNDVWQSDDGGATWTCVNASAGWPGRVGHTAVAVGDSIVLMGGKDTDDTLLNDVWRSDDGGATWTEVNAGAGWTARHWHTSVALPDGSIILIGGYDGANQNDVWRSDDGGATWEMVTTSDPIWSPRQSHTSVTMPDGSIVLMGGYDGANQNDVWRSDDGGATWTEVNASSGWPARYLHTSVAMPDGSIVVMGGYDGAQKNDVWRSTDGGATWTQLPDAGWPARYLHTSVAMPDGSILVMGGDNGSSQRLNDVWRLETAGSSLQNPSHEYDAPGTYTVALQASNAGGYDSTRRTDYITVEGPVAPTAAFSGTPTSGAAPLTVSFTDASTGDPTGWAWFFGDETYNQTWTQLPDAGWSGRTGHTSAVMSDGSIVVMGGFVNEDPFGAIYLDDVWRSADGGATWTQVNTSPGWAARRHHTSIAMPDGSIILMGGSDGSERMNDVWRSEDGGGTWTRQTNNAEWTARLGHTVVAAGDDIILMGGYDGAHRNDVWRSDDYGATWEEVTTSGPIWPVRQCHTSVALPDGSIVLMGGHDVVQMNDVWRSDDGGATWTQLPDPGWAARAYHTAVAMPDGSIVIMGGFDSSSLLENDVWRSTDNGTTWTQLPDAGWTPRYYHTSVAMPDGSIVLMGGSDNSYLNDVWRLETAGSTAENPSHTYTTPGTYTVALQASNAGGYDSTRRIDYITVEGPVAPTAAFTGSPTSGAAPLTVSFTDASTGSPTGWAWFFGDETYDQAWTQVTEHAGWTARHYHTSVAMPNGSIVLMGGRAEAIGCQNDTWRSDDGGMTWVQLPDAGWSVRDGHTAVAMPDGRIVLMGGNDPGNYRNDTWLSPDGGEHWERMTENAGWTARWRHASVVMPDGSIILMGGEGITVSYNDTWRLADGETTWELVTGSSGWTARHGHTSVVMPNGNIVLMGGQRDGSSNYDCLNDTWLSTNGGATWTLVNESSGWLARCEHTSVVMPDGSILLMGGYYSDEDTSEHIPLNDVWRSTDNGTTWTQLPDAGWLVRKSHAAVAMPDGSILLMGGEDDLGTILNDVWQLQPAGSNAQNPSHEYDTPGTYTVALQASNAGGYDSTRQIDYITVSAAPGGPTAAFTGTPTSGATPLTVQFTDTSAGSPIVWNWSFGDGAWHNTTDAAERNATHTYAAPGTYTVSLTVDNAAGSDTHTEAGYITVTAAGALTAAFTGTPTSGAAPLTVDFTDASTGGPTGWAWFFGDETYDQAWTPVNASAGWTARMGHTSAVMPDGSIVLMGGVDGFGNRFHDTWRSDDGGATWTRVNESAGWNARLYHTSVAIGNTIVLMGGHDGINYLNDVWRSDDSGASWTQLPNAGWTTREGHTNVALPDGSIVLMGGTDGTRQNDVWRSDDNGTTWTRVTEHAEWSARHAHASVAIGNTIVLMGGEEGSGLLNDTWRSIDGGEHWELVNASPGWTARATHTSVAMPDGSILVMGGLANSGRLNDVWRSTDGGETWVQLPDAGWTERYYQTGVALPDGSIVIMGGDADTRQNDIWRLQPAGSSLQNPSHEYAAAGTYTVALQAFNAVGYDATQRSITVTDPTPTPTATPTTTPTPTRRPSAGGGGGGSTGGPDGYNVGGDSAVSKVNVTGTGIKTFIITGWKQSSPGSGIPPAPPIVYQYIDLVPARFETITGANITFTVPQAWLDEHGFTPEEIVMYRYNGTAWEALPTWVVDAAGTTVTFRAATPGFSLFAITGIEQAGEVTTPTAAQTTVQAVAEPTATETAAAPPGGPAPEFPLGTVALVAGAVLVLAAGGYLVRRWWMHRQNPALFREYD